MIAIVQAHAYDEAILFENKQIVLRVLSDSLDSFSEVNSFGASLIWTAVILLGFLAVLIKLILPDDVAEPMLAQIGMHSTASKIDSQIKNI